MSGEDLPPIFDKSVKALSFALNHTKSMYAQPLMSKVANALSEAEGDRPLRILSEHRLGGLDGAAQAGLIYLQLKKLPDHEILALICRAAVPAFPCSCRSPCCMGVRPNSEWITAIKSMSDYVREAQNPSPPLKGKKTINTPPQLRRMLVEKHFGRKYVIADLAEKFQVTEATITNHRKPITRILTDVEKSGWTNLDSYLTEVGIVGALL